MNPLNRVENARETNGSNYNDLINCKFIPQLFSELVISLENIKDQMSYSKFTGH